MRRFQPVALTLACSVFLAGCQAIPDELKTSQPLKPNTTQHLIENAKAELNQYEHFDVSDEGMILSPLSCRDSRVTLGIQFRLPNQAIKSHARICVTSRNAVLL